MNKFNVDDQVRFPVGNNRFQLAKVIAIVDDLDEPDKKKYKIITRNGVRLIVDEDDIEIDYDNFDFDEYLPSNKERKKRKGA